MTTRKRTATLPRSLQRIEKQLTSVPAPDLSVETRAELARLALAARGRLDADDTAGALAALRGELDGAAG